MAAHTKVTTAIKGLTRIKSSGGYFSGARLAQNVRAFIDGIKKHKNEI